MADVPVTELARRICIANHIAEIGYPSKQVPCSVHIQEAKTFYGLVQEKYSKTLDVIIEAAKGVHA